MSTDLRQVDESLDEVEAHGFREVASVGAAIAALAVAAPAAAMSSGPGGPGTESALVSSDASRSTELAQSYFERVWAGDFAAAAELTAPGVKIRGPLFAATDQGGCERIVQAVERYTRGFPDVRFEVQSVSTVDNSVSIAWIAYGTHEGAFFGLRPTGVETRVEGTTTYTLRDGLITEEVYDFDLAGLVAQLAKPGR